MSGSITDITIPSIDLVNAEQGIAASVGVTGQPWVASIYQTNTTLPDFQNAIKVDITIDPGFTYSRTLHVAMGPFVLTLYPPTKTLTLTLGDRAGLPVASGEIIPPFNLFFISLSGTTFNFDYRQGTGWITQANIESILTPPEGSGGTGVDLAPVLDAISGAVQTLSSVVTDKIDAGLAKSEGAISATLNTVSDAITASISTAQSAIDRVGGQITGVIAPGLQSVTNTVLGTENAIISDITGAVSSVSGLISGLDQHVQGVASDVIAGSSAIVAEVEKAVQGETSALLSSVNTLETSLSTPLDHLATSVSDIAAELKSAALPDLSKLFDPLGPILIKSLKEILNSFTGLDVDPPSDATLQAISRILRGEEPQGAILDTIGSFPLLGPIFRELAIVFLGGVVGGEYLKGLLSASSEGAANSARALLRTTIPPVGDILTALYRGTIASADATRKLAGLGLTDGDQAFLIDNARSIPGIIELMQSLNRGFIDEATFRNHIKDLRFSEVWQDNFVRLSQVLPSIADLLFMMRRDAFIPAFVEQYGMLQEFPSDELDFFKQQGLSEFWALKYWAAHWDLPSTEMGFRMFQRGIIDQDNLNRLLRANGVEPFWRDKLTAIAYNPITRIDVRRLNKVGLLDRAGMIDRYLKIGYAPEDAKLLAQFTEQLNKTATDSFAVELASLSRAVIVDVYKSGIVSRDDAKAALVFQGEPPDAVEAYLHYIDLQEELLKRKAESQLVIDEYDTGAISFETAVGQLAAIGLDTVEQAKYADKLNKVRKSHMKIPTRAELDSMLKHSLISVDTYRVGMQALGYADAWIDKFVILVQRGILATA